MSDYKRTLVRMDDIKFKLKSAEKISNKICIRISDFEDLNDADMAEITIDVEEFRTMASCLQVLYCNEETIRTALTRTAEMQAAIVELREVLGKVRGECFDDSEYAEIIDQAIANTEKWV